MGKPKPAAKAEEVAQPVDILLLQHAAHETALMEVAQWFEVGTNIEDWKREAVAKKLREMLADYQRANAPGLADK